MRKVLFIDDDVQLVRLIEHNLSQVLKAYSGYEGIEALELINNTHFDLIFLDLLMPEFDGAELFGRIRQMDQQISVVIITGYPNSEVMGRAMGHGPFMVLKKPFTGDDILNAVSSFTRSVGARA